jgi:hypothetical protein
MTLADPRLVEDFDDGIAGWTSGALALSESAFDEDGQMEGGALRVSGFVENLNGAVFSECFPIDPAAPVVFGISAFSPQSNEYVARATLRVYDHPACGGPSDQLVADLVTRLGAETWGPIQGHGEVPASAQAARLMLQVLAVGSPETEVFFDNAFVHQDTLCAPASMVACLNEGRFRFSATWKTPEGMHGSARVADFAGGDSAYATFFSAQNVEVVLKVLDGCGVNERFWVFASGLTNVETTLTVTDTHTGTKWTAKNPLNEPFLPLFDTDAFQACPQ